MGPVDPGRLWRWLPLVRLYRWTRWLRSYDRPGLIWASNPMLATASILAGHGKRTIFNPAGCVAAMRRIGRLYPQATTMRIPAVTQWMDRFAWRRSLRTVVASQNVARQLVLAYGGTGRVDVEPLGVELSETLIDPATARRRWGIDPKAFVIGFVGRLDPCKGLDFLFDAVCQSGPAMSTRLLVVGDGPDKARLHRRVEDMGLARHVIWAGAMDDPTSAYAAMDTFVLPSIYEGFGLVVLEAMAAGVPVLGRKGNGATILTACDEIIEHSRTGALFESHDPSKLARQLRHLEAQPELARTIGSAGRLAVRDKTWANYTQRCLKILDFEWNAEPSNAYLRKQYRQAA